ncbi:cytochrome P450 9e2-like [Hyposmocoma kahamanoa]|uniref:cytochrome P450 9e2-like n=1 Tax=Hyposmocoma kahamanoa TaxID=1477025 RepID=UPI000E6D73F0|nr:cytochrome P450 9e2-like [Hyposmocoma kahamanoa]
MGYEHYGGTKKILSFVAEDWKLLLFLTILFALYFYYTSTFDFFEKKGVPYLKPTIFLGTLGPRLIGKRSFHDFQLDIYKHFQGKPYGGIFEGRRPNLYVFNPDLIKAVTIRDFDHFVDRNFLNLNQPRYLSRSLLHLKVAEKFNYMSKSKRFLIFFVLMFMPKIFQYLNISLMHRETCAELMRMLKAAKAERRQSGVRKNDFLQLLLDTYEEDKKSDNMKCKFLLFVCLDDDTIDAQALLFLIAGYETSGTLLSFAVHTLAIHPELQENLRANIKEETEGKELSYDLLMQLPMLEGFLLETLRIYPPFALVDRLCVKEYTLPGTNVMVDVGDVVSVNIIGIHMDPNYYPEPEKFKPERFMYDEKKNRPSHLFLPFGLGSRNCIGLRFAMLSVKTAMVALVKNFKFSICEKTENPVKFSSSGGILLKAENGLWVRIEAL